MVINSPAGELSTFLAAALRSPGTVGAAAPSSAGLARLLSTVVPTSGTPTVLEIGAGTGAVSGSIRARLPEGGRHLAVEVDPVLGDFLARRFPGSEILRGDVAELGTLLDGASVSTVDAVVSGLPWSLFDEAQQRRILTGIGRAMAPGAGFTTFAYRHAAGLRGARRFKALLHRQFEEVVLSRTVWLNLPPALVYVCRRPVAAVDG